MRKFLLLSYFISYPFRKYLVFFSEIFIKSILQRFLVNTYPPCEDHALMSSQPFTFTRWLLGFGFFLVGYSLPKRWWWTVTYLLLVMCMQYVVIGIELFCNFYFLRNLWYVKNLEFLEDFLLISWTCSMSLVARDTYELLSNWKISRKLIF